VPRRSGTHIAEVAPPRSFSGGNVIGTRMMQVENDCSPSTFQNGLLFRKQPQVGLTQGQR